jgi:hypothetical protein
MRRPFENLALVATRNALRTLASSSQYMEITTDSKFNFGTSDFAISYILRDELTTSNSVSLGAQASVNASWANVAHGNLGIELILRTAEGNLLYASEVGVTSYTNNRVSRVTLQRTGTKLEVYINTRLIGSLTIPGTDTFNLSGSATPIVLGTRASKADSYFTGLIGNVIFIKGGSFNPGQLNFLNETNLIPKDLHQYVIAHYPLNQTYGGTAFDVVEQYNYSKVTPVSASHATLNNYSNAEKGEPGLSTQSAFKNLYDKTTSATPSRPKALRLVSSSNHHLTVSGFNPTKENGYTIIIGYFLESDRAFDAAAAVGAVSETLMEADVSTLKWIAGIEDDKRVDFIQNNGAFELIVSDAKKLNKPQYVAFVEKDGTTSKAYINGFLSATNTGLTIEFSGTLYIGIRKNLTRPLNGYLTHISIYKGTLKQSEILDIINNSMFDNPPFDYIMDNCQLYLNFDSIVNNAGTYEVNDWSPQNRTVVLNNYTANEINPVHADYKLFELDSLR